MLERIHLENFKASRDVDVRLAPLTVLAGLNSTGKSSLLQAVSLVKQSYDANGRTEGLSLSGPLVHLGQYQDVLSEGAVGDAVVITINEGGKDFRWIYRDRPSATQLQLDAAPTSAPPFVKSSNFQFLQADRMVPRTLYPQAPHHDRSLGFLGAHGEYTVDFLSRSSNRVVNKARAFPRTGLGVNADLLGKVAPTDGLLDQVSGWLQQLSPGARLAAASVDGTDEVLLQFNYVGKLRESGSNAYRPTNVGFGLTYCLPIIVSCLAAPGGSLLLMENPEAHLHPQGQASLGELISRCVNDGVQVIVETHSDHLLNGVRLAVKNKHIGSDDVVLHFFSRATETGDVSVQSPAVLADGRVSNWPDGFFDQWDRDIEALLE